MWFGLAWLGLSNFFFCRTDLLGHVLHTISYSNCSGVCCFTCLPLSHYPPLHPLHSCTSFTFSLLSPFSSHFCMALLVIFSIGFTAIFGLIMRAFEIAYLVACPSVCPSACLSVGLSAWLADWLVAHMLQARLDCIWRQLSLICWLEICEKQTQTCLLPPFLLFFTIETISLFIVSSSVQVRASKFVA